VNKDDSWLIPPPPVVPKTPQAPIVPGGAQVCDFSSPFLCTVRQEQAFTSANVYGLGGPKGACISQFAPYGEDRCHLTTAGTCAATTTGSFYPGMASCPSNTTFVPADVDAWISPEGKTSVTPLIGAPVGK
jgi:hypothetical protein